MSSRTLESQASAPSEPCSAEIVQHKTVNARQKSRTSRTSAQRTAPPACCRCCRGIVCSRVRRAPRCISCAGPRTHDSDSQALCIGRAGDALDVAAHVSFTDTKQAASTPTFDRSMCLSRALIATPLPLGLRPRLCSLHILHWARGHPTHSCTNRRSTTCSMQYITCRHSCPRRTVACGAPLPGCTVARLPHRVDPPASHAPQPPLLSGVDVSSQLSAVCREHVRFDAVEIHFGLAAAAPLAAAAAPA